MPGTRKYRAFFLSTFFHRSFFRFCGNRLTPPAGITQKVYGFSFTTRPPNAFTAVRLQPRSLSRSKAERLAALPQH